MDGALHNEMVVMRNILFIISQATFPHINKRLPVCWENVNEWKSAFTYTAAGNRCRKKLPREVKVTSFFVKNLQYLIDVMFRTVAIRIFNSSNFSGFLHLNISHSLFVCYSCLQAHFSYTVHCFCSSFKTWSTAKFSEVRKHFLAFHRFLPATISSKNAARAPFKTKRLHNLKNRFQTLYAADHNVLHLTG